MKKNIIVYILIITGGILSSCESWLDVTPPSQIREEAQFSSVSGFQQALIGCYISMADEMLYGRALTWSTKELMAGQFSPLQPSISNDYAMSVHNYTASSSVKYINGIWLKAYNIIANANNALKYIELKKETLDNIDYRIIKGELLAIRAKMHFELIQLYGYGNLANRVDIAGKFTIPYVTTLAKDLTPQQSYSQTLSYIIEDLTEAVELLAIDPVTKSHPDSYYLHVNTDGFYNNRANRLNYYATNLILAQVYMWEGSVQNIDKAKDLALMVIDKSQSNSLTHWATGTSMATDVILKSEHLFSLNTQNLNLRTAEFFKIDITEAADIKAQYITYDRLTQIYETFDVGDTDYRFSRLYIQNSLVINGQNCYTPLKFYGTMSTTVTNNFIPLVRLPEAYYIAAEASLKGSSADATLALELLNTVRNNRGVTTPITVTDVDYIMWEIVKEYQKEFVCEGKMFSLYKRLGLEEIPGQSTMMTDEQYLLPYPSTELQMGRKQ